VSLGWDDRLAIRELVALYDRAIDDGDAAAWAACFTEDGVWDAGAVKVEGRDALEAFRGARHACANFDVEGDGDEARLRCDNLMLRPGDAGVTAFWAADYDDRVRRVDGRWLFASRRTRPVRG
jgi:uncharacterized protein (TIGR02246 family)